MDWAACLQCIIHVHVYFFKFCFFNFQAFQVASKYEKAIRNDKHIMSFAIYELAVIHISRDEVMNDMNY